MIYIQYPQKDPALRVEGMTKRRRPKILGETPNPTDWSWPDLKEQRNYADDSLLSAKSYTGWPQYQQQQKITPLIY